MVIEQSRHIRFGVFWRGGADHDFRNAVGRERIFDIAPPIERFLDPVGNLAGADRTVNLSLSGATAVRCAVAAISISSG
jgi:hypothetical protein